MRLNRISEIGKHYESSVVKKQQQVSAYEDFKLQQEIAFNNRLHDEKEDTHTREQTRKKYQTKAFLERQA